jgi:phenylacetate-CoA ligase
MHFTGQGLVYPELIDPASGDNKEWIDGAKGELVYSAINRECLPLLRFRTHDHVEVVKTSCPCGRGTVCIRGVGRTDNMFIVRGVNVFPSAVKDLVSNVEGTTGHLRIYLDSKDGQSVTAPVDVTVEVTDTAPSEIRGHLEDQIREELQFQADVKIVNAGTFERAEYKSDLVEYR